MTDTDRRILVLQRSIEELYDHQVRQRRMLADILYNLDEENMPAVKELIERYKAEDGEAIAALRVAAGENYAAIESLAAVQTEQGERVASVKQQAEKNSASIESLAAVQTEQGDSIASISQQADALGAEVTVAVERAGSAENAASAAESAANDASEKVANGAYIIARVNEDGSLVKIKADKLELSGYATFNSLKTAGATEIDGANLKTGTVTADRIALNANGQINLDKLGTLSFFDPSGATGEIRMSENEYGRGEIAVNADGTVLFGAGSASLMLLDTGSGSTEMSVYSDYFRMNGERGISGTYSLGGGSITVENGIVVGISEGSGGDSGGGGDEGGEITLDAPIIWLDGESASFSITNPNDVGTIAYYSYWYDDNGNSGDSRICYDNNSSTSDYIFDFPPGGGYIGVSAWIEYDGRTSPGASEETWYA